MSPRALLRLTFRRAQRLGDAAGFAVALRSRPVAASPHFQIFRPPTQYGARLGVIVGKRFVARSVDRNKLKRLIRDVFRTRKFELPPTDHVVRVRNPIRAIDTLVLRAEIVSLLGLES